MAEPGVQRMGWITEKISRVAEVDILVDVGVAAAGAADELIEIISRAYYGCAAIGVDGRRFDQELAICDHKLVSLRLTLVGLSKIQKKVCLMSA